MIKAIMFAQIVDKFNSVENSQLSPQRSGIFKSRDELESLESPPSLLHLQRDSQNEESSNLIDISNGIPNNRNPPAKFASGGSNSTMTTDENSPIRRKNSIGSYTEVGSTATLLKHQSSLFLDNPNSTTTKFRGSRPITANPQKKIILKFRIYEVS